MLLGSPVHVASCQNPTVTTRPAELLGAVGVVDDEVSRPPQAAVVKSSVLHAHTANTPTVRPRIGRPFAPTMDTLSRLIDMFDVVLSG